MNTDRFYLECAIQQAEYATGEGTYPIGAVVVGPRGEILGQGRNRVYSQGDLTGHAELDALRHAGSLLLSASYRRCCTLYTTMEPCLMCTGALVMAMITRVVWVLNDEGYGALRQLQNGPLYAQEFSGLRVLQTPEQDLITHAQQLLDTWNRQKGQYKARWQ